MLIKNICDLEKPFKMEVTERPWGKFELFAENEKCTPKIIKINSGNSLSLQYHLYRDQLYVMIDAGIGVTFSDIQFDHLQRNDAEYIKSFLQDHVITKEAKAGDVFAIKTGYVHRTSYAGDLEYARFLDLAYGYNDEEDIIRLSDNYGRLDGLQHGDGSNRGNDKKI